ncbi:MAG: hypothetical protein HY022_08470 [Chloroflexi bacterium]|nr:hypothetical protein [Chloroflexota bacterium]
MSKRTKDPDVMLKQAYESLSNDEKRTEPAKGQTVEQVYGFIQKGERKKAAQFVYNRFYRRYLMPFEKVDPDFNSGFAQMAASCLMIEAMESFRNGWKTTHRLKVAGKEIYVGKVFEDFFKHYSEFAAFESLGNEFYDSIRCGILHQAETKNGWRITREEKYPLWDKNNRRVHSTRFRYQMKLCLRKYCNELQNDNNVWDRFEIKMASVIRNCHKGNLKKTAKS